jgi:hypothetical protein
MLDLQDIFGAVFDGVSDSVPVRRTEHERLQNQQVERALEQLAFQRR